MAGDCSCKHCDFHRGSEGRTVETGSGGTERLTINNNFN